MSDSKIRIGITQGDVNGIGYEVIIKTLCDPRMCELCTPIVYGSAKAASFYKKQIDAAENFGFSTVVSAREAAPKRISLVDCVSGDLRVEPGVLSAAAGEASVAALRAAAADLKAGRPRGENYILHGQARLSCRWHVQRRCILFDFFLFECGRV